MATVALVQHDIVWEDSSATLAAITREVGAAAHSGAELIVLAEMFATGFSMEVDRTAQGEDGTIVAWMRSQAHQHNVHIAGSVAIRSAGDRPTNRLLIVGPDGVVARYDKIHPFSYANEHERFAAGQQPVIATVAGLRWGLTVCYDLRFADLYWKMAPDVDAYLVVANWPRARTEHWKALLVARAIENQAWVVGVNRVGEGGGLDYAGASMVVDPLGRTVVSAAEQSALLLTDVTSEITREVRASLPFLADRRT